MPRETHPSVAGEHLADAYATLIWACSDTQVRNVERLKNWDFKDWRVVSLAASLVVDDPYVAITHPSEEFVDMVIEKIRMRQRVFDLVECHRIMDATEEVGSG